MILRVFPTNDKRHMNSFLIPRNSKTSVIRIYRSFLYELGDAGIGFATNAEERLHPRLDISHQRAASVYLEDPCRQSQCLGVFISPRITQIRRRRATDDH